jgi:tetratricopeptide (TPR) repeat protein
VQTRLRIVTALLHSCAVGTLHQITEHRRFDPAELTLSTSRNLAAAPDGRLSPVVLDRLDGVAAMLARSYPQVGPFRLMSPVAALLSETARRARSAPTGERQRLVRTLAHLGVLAGHMSFDLGQTGYVDGYFGGALGAVEEAGDRDMRVWALASWSVVPVNSRAPARAVEFLDDAVWLARRGQSRSRLGWVLALRARAMADLGERRQALALLSDAYEALTEPQEERHPTDFFDLARLDAMAGACLLQLGRYADATDSLSRALCARPATDRKGRSLALLELAAAHVRQDEPDEACRNATAALTGADADVLVAPVARRAGQVVASLQLHSSRPAVVELRQMLHQTIANGSR